MEMTYVTYSPICTDKAFFPQLRCTHPFSGRMQLNSASVNLRNQSRQALPGYQSNAARYWTQSVV
jgi:hypothetical protein